MLILSLLQAVTSAEKLGSKKSLGWGCQWPGHCSNSLPITKKYVSSLHETFQSRDLRIRLYEIVFKPLFDFELAIASELQDKHL